MQIKNYWLKAKQRKTFLKLFKHFPFETKVPIKLNAMKTRTKQIEQICRKHLLKAPQIIKYVKLWRYPESFRSFCSLLLVHLDLLRDLANTSASRFKSREADEKCERSERHKIRWSIQIGRFYGRKNMRKWRLWQQGRLWSHRKRTVLTEVTAIGQISYIMFW